MTISNFHDIHAGGTILLVGNGLNLAQTPPAWFDYPSIGMNTIHKYEGWMPTYYTAVDSRVMREFGDEISEKYRDIPKFIPRPNLDKWQGENFYRFYHRPGPLYPASGLAMSANFLDKPGITYGNVMHIAMQLALFMGAATILIIGMEHKPFKAQEHFWGCDHGMTATPPIEDWWAGYKEIVQNSKARILNLSVGTFVPEAIVPRDDWKKYAA